MFKYSMLVTLLILLIRNISISSLSLSTLFDDYNVSSSIIIYPKNRRDFGDSVRLANQRCESFCPDVVIRPNTVEDISNVMRMIHTTLIKHNTSIPFTVKGGGHSYSCQSVRDDGILLDMRNFDDIHVNGDVVNVGAGLTFEKVFKILNKNDRTIIHGQCLQVGVVGFTVHGGVHFGSLSNVYGLGSDNIVGLNMVLANGTVVEIYTKNDNSIECLIDGAIGDSYECTTLLIGMSGAGSSFGIVTSLDLRLVKSSHLRTALTILTIDTTDIANADQFFQNYVSNFPSDMSVTFFGLDEYFKTYFFLIKFAKNKFEAASKARFSNLFKRYKDESIHFIVEVSWVDNNAIPSFQLHPILQKMNTESQVPWFVSSEPWSVPSYELVWGSGHYFSGASITVDKQYTSNVVKTVFDSFNKLKANKFCSDCVIVIHRVGEGLKRAQEKNKSSFNSFLKDSHMWIEVDCGHFFRRQILNKDWQQCSAFVDNLQNQLDKNTVDESRMHYPNVPNLQTENWPHQYYGSENYGRLQSLKSLIDPNNIFNHNQSIEPLSIETYKQFKTFPDDNKGKTCTSIYFHNGLKDIKTALKLVFLTSGLTILVALGANIWSSLRLFYL